MGQVSQTRYSYLKLAFFKASLPLEDVVFARKNPNYAGYYFSSAFQIFKFSCHKSLGKGYIRPSYKKELEANFGHFWRT